MSNVTVEQLDTHTLLEYHEKITDEVKRRSKMISHQEADREEGIVAAGNHAGESWPIEPSIEYITIIAVQVYDTGTTKPAMAGRLAAVTGISKRESVLVIEAIDRYVDQHGEDNDNA